MSLIAAHAGTGYRVNQVILIAWEKAVSGYDLSFPLAPKCGREQTIEQLVTPDDRILLWKLDVETFQSPYLHLEGRLSPNVPSALRDRVAVARKLGTYGYFCYDFHAVSVFWSFSAIEMALKLRFAEVHPGPLQIEKRGSRPRQVDLHELESYLRRGWRIPGLQPDFNYSFKALLAWAFSEGLLPPDIAMAIQEIAARYQWRFRLQIFPDWAQDRGLMTVHSGTTLEEIDACWQQLGESDRQSLLKSSGQILAEELPRFRNEMAHPQQYQLISVPNAGVRAFDLLTDICRLLWPGADETAP